MVKREGHFTDIPGSAELRARGRRRSKRRTRPHTQITCKREPDVLGTCSFASTLMLTYKLYSNRPHNPRCPGITSNMVPNEPDARAPEIRNDRYKQCASLRFALYNQIMLRESPSCTPTNHAKPITLVRTKIRRTALSSLLPRRRRHRFHHPVYPAADCYPDR